MKRMYAAEAIWDAQMVRDLLLTNGIDAKVAPEYSQIEFADPQSVWILNDEDEPRAAEIIHGFRSEPIRHQNGSASAWKWRCRSCGEDVEEQFEICWNCGAERVRL